MEARAICVYCFGGGLSFTCSGWLSKLSGADDIVSSAILHRDQEPHMRAATLSSVKNNNMLKVINALLLRYTSYLSLTLLRTVSSTCFFVRRNLTQ